MGQMVEPTLTSQARVAPPTRRIAGSARAHSLATTQSPRSDRRAAEGEDVHGEVTFALFSRPPCWMQGVAPVACGGAELSHSSINIVAWTSMLQYSIPRAERHPDVQWLLV